MGTADGGASSSTSETPGAPPAWAQRMRRSQAISHGVSAAAHAVRSGDGHGGGSSISLSESDRT
jgi:type IV secretion system protein TrbL